MLASLASTTPRVCSFRREASRLLPLRRLASVRFDAKPRVSCLYDASRHIVRFDAMLASLASTRNIASYDRDASIASLLVTHAYRTLHYRGYDKYCLSVTLTCLDRFIKPS